MAKALALLYEDHCPINCSGGCPSCAPDDHSQECVAVWHQTDNVVHLHCHCDELTGAFDDALGG